MSANTAAGRTIETRIPARIDRLPWARWHWMVVIGLGAVWILDGLEVTIVGAVAGRISSPGSGLNLTTAQVGLAAGIYVAGACLGALFFGYLTDRLGRKKLFILTLLLYLAATVATAFSFTAMFFFACRFVTGMGIGGEYAAINSAIDELIPARVRGTVDLMINGAYWLGAAAAAALSLVLLDPKILPANVGWRLAFGLGAVLGLGILFVRRTVPESPRWLFIHGRDEEAEAIVRDIEEQVGRSVGSELEEPRDSIKIQQRDSVGFGTIVKTVFAKYPRRSILGFSLFIGQAFLYNAIFFTYALVLSTFYKVPVAGVGWYLVGIAMGNFFGPLVLARLFDTVGRRWMISGTYILSGVALAITAWLFLIGALNATTQTLCWMAIFFLASAGASSAYLTVSEVFPMETRAMAIAFFYAIGTAAGGIVGPVLFGNLVATKQASMMFIGYMIGAALMAGAGVVEIFLGVDAEQKSLEDVAAPISAQDDGVTTGEESGSHGGRSRQGRPSATA